MSRLRGRESSVHFQLHESKFQSPGPGLHSQAIPCCLLAVFLYPGEMQLLTEDIITEEEVLAQIAWDICKGFLNTKVELINMDSV